VQALAGGSARGGDRSWWPDDANMDAGGRHSEWRRASAAGCVSQKE
jgi:hypothetical protein